MAGLFAFMGGSNMPKAQYEAPELIDAGLFEEITEGGANGSVLDASFSAGTPVSDLTFS
ncbi:MULTISPECIES: lasso RiPP family leader peptide-containing protein [unclassified Sphingomonas]|nr:MULTISPECIES: lasso RiPP family leader peptide-containing protein [unclassified Sphingomonas]